MSKTEAELAQGVFTAELLKSYQLGDGYQAEFISNEWLSLPAQNGRQFNVMLKRVEPKILGQPTSISQSDVEEIVRTLSIANTEAMERDMRFARNRNENPEVIKANLQKRQEFYIRSLGSFATTRGNLWVGQSVPDDTPRIGRHTEVAKFMGFAKGESSKAGFMAVHAVVKTRTGDTSLYSEPGTLYIVTETITEITGIKSAKPIRPDLFGSMSDGEEGDVRPPIA